MQMIRGCKMRNRVARDEVSETSGLFSSGWTTVYKHQQFSLAQKISGIKNTGIKTYEGNS